MCYTDDNNKQHHASLGIKILSQKKVTHNFTGNQSIEQLQTHNESAEQLQNVEIKLQFQGWLPH